jgi:hypothetical protein
MRTRTVALCVTAAAVLAGTTGCGAHHSHPGGASPTTASTQQARAVARAQARQAVDAAVQALAGKHFAAFTAVLDIYGKHGTVKGTCTWGPGGLRTDEFIATTALGMQSFVRSKTMETRQIGTAIYYGVGPQSPRGPLRGKHWIRVDLSAYSSAQVLNVETRATGDPMVYLRRLAAAPDLRRVGRETVDGKSTTHYAGTVPATAAKKNIGLGAPSLSDVWLTDDGTMVRYAQDVAGVEGTLDYTRFAADGSIQAPPAADTIDRTESVRRARQQAMDRARGKK